MRSRVPHTIIDNYDELLVHSHRASTEEHLARATLERSLVFRGHPVCNVLRPFFMTSDLYTQIMRAATLVSRGITVVAERLAKDESFRRLLGLSPEKEALMRLDPGEPTELVGRLDGFIGPDGVIRFVEYNAGPAGVIETDDLCETFAEMPIMRSMSRRHTMRRSPRTRHLIAEALRSTHARKGGKGLPNVAVLSAPSPDQESLLAVPEMLKVLDALVDSGVDLRLVEPAQLAVDGGRLRAGDFHIDSVLVADWASFLQYVPEDAPFWGAIQSGKAWIINSAATAIVRGSKSVFAILSDPAHAHLFERDIAEGLRRHVPWTRRVSSGYASFGGRAIDLIPFITDAREHLVLKPAGEHGGNEIVLGWESSEASWQSAIERAATEPFIVQERVTSLYEDYPDTADGVLRFDTRISDIHPFVWNHQWPHGCSARVSKSSITNVPAEKGGDGSRAPIFLVDT